jgi:hypothetical protein
MASSSGSYKFKEWAMLGGVGLQAWADEGDLERAE